MWIHGGGYRFGNGSGAYIDSDLVSKDVILITINYRLGSLGYFAHPALSAESEFSSSGNYGTLDQIQALKWIHENIEKFGGDSNNITIFGESAGGHAVRQLMSSPLAKGLFHKAIAQSSYSIGNTLYLKNNSGIIQSAENSGKDFVKILGLKEDGDLLENLRSIPAEDLQQVGDGMVNPEDASNVEDYVISAAWMPNVDGWVFNDSALSISRTGQTHDIPLLIGFNSFEGSSLLPMFYTKDQHVNDKDWIQTIWDLAIPNDPNNIIKDYREWAKNIEKESYLAAQKLWGDVQFGSSTYYSALNHSKVNPNTYFYYFNRSPVSKKQIIGATHGIEIMYLFNAFIPGWPKNELDNRIGEQMRDDWTDFAKTGDLSSKGWTRFSEENQIQKNYDENLDYSTLVEMDLFKSIYKYLDESQN
jgi:para-nitrobenzyl esterase